MDELAVSRALRSVPKEPREVTAGARATIAPRVLVVEDDTGIRDLITGILGDEGYEIDGAANGDIAIQLAAERTPDVILLDMQMPVMDGWAFARAYRELMGAPAPIIVLTAGKNPEASAAEIGAACSLAKPFDVDDLLAVVGEYASRT